jgi:cellobiose phosphorylase
MPEQREPPASEDTRAGGGKSAHIGFRWSSSLTGEREVPTRFGRFDDDAHEYVISRVDTPLPWINYLGSEDYFGIISNTGGGYSFYKDASLRRLIRYRYNNAPQDVGGRFLYLRDRDSGDYWAPTWQPTRSDLDDYVCRHGLGYTVISSRRRGIACQTLYLVPLGETLEMWHCRVTNDRREDVSLSLFGAVEFCLWDAWDDATNFQRNLSIGEVEVDNNVVFHKTEYRERRDHFAYFACSEQPVSFDTQRDEFLGSYRGWDHPLAVEQGRCTNSIAHGWAPCGVHQVDLEIGPGETRDVTFLLGYHENPGDAKFDPPDSQTLNKRSVGPVIARHLDKDEPARALAALRDYWRDVLGNLQVHTPNEHVDRMVNLWNAYQCLVTFNLSRSASFFESGIGRGMGFRDSNQDLLGFVHMIPERARHRILDVAATQLADGGAYHQYQPLTKRGNDAIGGGFNDDPLWLILAVAAYVMETGDRSILDEPVPYDNEKGSEAPLYEHLVRAHRYTLDRLGPHRLPLIGRADWNDTLNLNAFLETPGASFQTAPSREGGAAESVFIAGLFVLVSDELAALAELRGSLDDALAFRAARDEMVRAIDEHGWDGRWFRRAFDWAGSVVGSSENAEGRIFIEPQGMCVMAGIGLHDGRARDALVSVGERLETPHGIVLHQPAYSRYYLELGEIGSYPPGYKENAGVFCHTNPWIVIAEILLGDPDRAFEHYLKINPSVREAISDVHRCEPYVYAQMIAGKDAAKPGEAKNSWLTGSAAWNFVAITQWILGIRPEWGGLRIDPCLPTTWQGYKATRRFRGAIFNITVRRVADKEGRIDACKVDGRWIEGNVVPPAASGTFVTVEALMGA